MFTAIWVPFRKVSLILAQVLLSSITNITPVIPVEVQNFWDRSLTRGLASPIQLPQDFRKDLPKNVSRSNQSCFVDPFRCCCCYWYHNHSSCLLPVLLSIYLSILSTVAPFWFSIINYQHRKKASKLIPFSTSTRRRKTNAGVGIKILILSSFITWCERIQISIQVHLTRP